MELGNRRADGLQEAHGPTSTRTGAEGPALSPLKAFALAGVLVTLALGTWLLTRGEDQIDAPPGSRGLGSTPSSSAGLSDDQALARFRVLREQALVSISSRDESLLRPFFVEGSAAYLKARTEIRQLLADDVVDEGRIELIRAAILSNDEDEIRIREQALFFPCFRTESGRDVTRGPRTIRQTGLWILRPEDGTWQVSRVLLEKERIIARGRGRCD